MSKAPITEARIAEAFGSVLLLTAEATATLLGVSVKTLKQMVFLGQIKVVRISPRSYRFSERCILDFLEPADTESSAGALRPTMTGLTELRAKSQTRQARSHDVTFQQALALASKKKPKRR